MRRSTDRSAKLLFATALIVGTLSTHAAHALDVTLDFDDVSQPTLVTSQYRDTHGVVFPIGVVVSPCEPDHCGAARSSPNVAHAGHDNESQGHPFVFEIPNGAASGASFFVRSDLNAHRNPSREILIGAQAFDASGVEVARDAVFTQTDADWASVQLGSLSGASQIKRVEVRIYGVRPDLNRNVEENFIAVDDLRVVGDITLPGRDTTRPTVEIVDPSVRTFVPKPVLDLTARASDDRDLSSVTAHLFEPGGLVSPRVYLCGTPASGACGAAYERTKQLNLSSFDPGLKTVVVTATDVAGNTREDSVEIDLVDVSLTFMEVNQSVQNGPSHTRLPGHEGEYFGRSPRIPGKDTLVRLYPFAKGYTAGGFGPSLRVRVTQRDGSTREIAIPPNVDGGTVTPAVDPGDFSAEYDEAVLMRMDPARTMDYVIPAAETRDAVDLHLGMLYRGLAVDELVHVPLSEPTAMGLNFIAIDYPFDDDRPPTLDQINTAMIPFVKAAYPVDEVRALSYIPFLPGLSNATGTDDCGVLLFEVWWVFGGDDAPVEVDFGKDYIIPTVGVAADGDVSGNGCGYVGDAAPGEDERIGSTVITRLLGDTAAHEIGHNLGFKHHGTFPEHSPPEDDYAIAGNHGAVGIHDYGAILEPVVEPSPGSYGQWSVFSIEPCPAGRTKTDGTWTCSSHAGEVHELMSYGSGTVTYPPDWATARGRWPSTNTYLRMWQLIAQNGGPGGDLGGSRAASADASSPEQPTAEAAGDRVEALLVSGFIGQDGSLDLLPVARKPVPREMLTNHEPDGPVTVELRGAAGEVLHTLRTSTYHLEVDGGSDDNELLRIALPFIEGVREIAVTGDGITPFTRAASAHAPDLRIVSPAGGTSLPDGDVTIRFEGSDLDGDDVHYLIQYSPDGGLRWQGIENVGPGEDQAVTVDTARLIPGERALFRVTASDGINTTVATVDCIAVGSSGPPVCDRGLDIKPASCPNVVNPNARGVLPAAITGSSGVDVGDIDPASIRLEGVPVLRSSYEDVASPFTPYSGKSLPADCSAAGPDGVGDLALKFDMEALRNALGAVAEGEVRVLGLTGSLRGGGTFTAEDVVTFVRAL